MITLGASVFHKQVFLPFDIDTVNAGIIILLNVYLRLYAVSSFTLKIVIEWIESIIAMECYVNLFLLEKHHHKVLYSWCEKSTRRFLVFGSSVSVWLFVRLCACK